MFGLVQVALNLSELGIHDGATGRPYDGVVREHHKFDVKDGAFADAADGDGKAAAQLAVEARLRPVRGVRDVDAVGGGRRHLPLLRLAYKARKRRGNLRRTRLLFQLYRSAQWLLSLWSKGGNSRKGAYLERHAFRVAVRHRDAVAMRANPHTRVSEAALAPAPKNL